LVYEIEYKSLAFLVLLWRTKIILIIGFQHYLSTQI
jgi:hypothetical protein